MKTAVEWLFQQLWEEPKDKLTWHSILEKAKQMEKEQSIAELRHKDGTPMRKYNSPKLQEIEMENKQTAVDWLVEMWDKNQRFLNPKQIIEQAKQMEKEQIIKAFNEGTFSEMEKIDAEQYYNQTFKSE
jgi:hypothetical protein